MKRLQTPPSRAFEFRAWHIPTQTLFPVHCFTNELVYPALPEWATSDDYSHASDNPHLLADCVLIQFTGLLDCPGKKVFEGDILYSFFPSCDDLSPSSEYWRLVAYRVGGFCELASPDEVTDDIDMMMLLGHNDVHERGIIPDRVVDCYYVKPYLFDLNTPNGNVPTSFDDETVTIHEISNILIY